MDRGFQMKRKYEERLHLETLICNRMNTSFLMNMHSKRTIKPEQLYTLSCDKKEVKITRQEMIEFFNKKVPVIDNGKLRGYMDKNGNLELIN